MLPRIALYGLAFALLFAAAAPSRAQNISDREYCFGEEQKLPFPRFIPTNETTIAGCTRLLNGGRLNAEDQLNALFRRADAFRRLKQYARSIADYNRMIALGDQRTDRIYYNRGITYYLMGRKAEAIGDFQRVAGSADPVAAAAARKALGELGAASPPSPPHQAHVLDLIRKAQAKENEDGFCAQVSWPRSGDKIRDVLALVTAAGGAAAVRLRLECSFVRVSPEFMEDGRKKRRMESWSCEIGKQCYVEREKIYEDSPGSWTSEN